MKKSLFMNNKDSPSAKIGRNIKKIRDERGIARSEVARCLGVIPQTVYCWETGRSRFPADKLKGMAEILKCSTEDILKGTGNGRARN